jgi:hypothetical protein
MKYFAVILRFQWKLWGLGLLDQLEQPLRYIKAPKLR